MSVLKIVRMGHLVLRQRASEIADPTHSELQVLAQDMIETMLDAGGIGLAAPQVNISRRMIVFRVPAERTTGQAGDMPAGVSVLINPEITPLSEETVEGWEGCLSMPGLRGAVPRYERIGYRGFDLSGKLIEREATGFHARVVQHELDHLDGILYIDRMRDLVRLSYVEEWHNFTQDKSE